LSRLRLEAVPAFRLISTLRFEDVGCNRG
jgi:hypothetical protein